MQDMDDSCLTLSAGWFSKICISLHSELYTTLCSKVYIGLRPEMILKLAHGQLLRRR